jgi:prolyl oligopeptidase
MDVRLWRRGESYENAIKLFEGEKSDVAVTGYLSRHKGIILEWRTRSLTFYTSKIYIRKLTDLDSWTVKNFEKKYSETKWHLLDIPDDASASQFDNQILIKLKSPWTTGGGTITHATGALLAVDLDEFLEIGKDFANFTTLFIPTERLSMDGFSKTLNHLIIETLDNVKSRVHVWKFSTEEGWVLLCSEEGTSVRGISVSAVDAMACDDCWVTSSSFTNPSTLSMLELKKCRKDEYLDLSKLCSPLKSLPSKFDATGVIEFQEVSNCE